MSSEHLDGRCAVRVEVGGEQLELRWEKRSES